MTKSIVVSIGYTKFKVPSHWTLDDTRAFIGMASELAAVDYHYDDGKSFFYSKDEPLQVSSFKAALDDSYEAAKRAAKRAAIEKQLTSEETK
jgi:hypothetical protein